MLALSLTTITFFSSLSMTIQRVLFVLLATILSLSVSGCDLLGTEASSGPTLSTTGVFVGNQGNFGDGNGSVTVFNPETQQAQPAVTNLSSIVQGIAVRDTSLFIMANSAARVDVFSTEGLSQTGQLTGLNGPRYLTFAGPNTAYVTDQQFFTSPDPDSIRVLDLSGGHPQLESSIDVPGTVDGITTTGDHVYAALGAFGDTSLVADVNVNQNTLTQTIDVDCTSRSLATDSDAEVFVLCADAPEAVILNGPTGEIQTRLSLPDTAETTFGVGQPASYAPEAQELYVATDTGILRIDTESNDVGPMIDVGGPLPAGAVAYDGVRDELYVARPSGPTERGSVTVHARDGTQKTSFQAGILPNSIDLQRVER